MPKPEKKGVEHNHYLDQVAQNHLIIREKLQEFNNKLPAYRDTASFFDELYPMMLEIDDMMAAAGTPELNNRADTLADASSGRLLNDYSSLINEHYISLFSVYHKAGDTLNAQEQQRVDSVWNLIIENDQNSLKVYFRFNDLDSATLSKFEPLYRQ